jgi:hypothetical protein
VTCESIRRCPRSELDRRKTRLSSRDEARPEVQGEEGRVVDCGIDVRVTEVEPLKEVEVELLDEGQETQEDACDFASDSLLAALAPVLAKLDGLRFQHDRHVHSRLLSS